MIFKLAWDWLTRLLLVRPSEEDEESKREAQPKMRGNESSKALVLEDADSADGEDGESSSSRVEWDSPIEFLLSCLSFAVGLGNIWRFPYLCYRNGGGAFLIPYALNIFLTGIPLFFFELAFGQFGSLSPVSIWCVAPLFQGLGISMLVICVGVGVYYNVIIAWAIYYAGATASSLFSADKLPWTTCDNPWNSADCVEFDDSEVHPSSAGNSSESAASEYFNRNMLKVSGGIDDPRGLRWELVCCLAAAWLVVFVALLNGVKSFGKAVYVTALFPYVILTVLLVRGLTLPGAIQGVMFYLTPDWSRLADVQVWADAAIQIFFSLGPCWGALITLASYNKFKNNCFRDAVFIGFANCLTSFFAGFVVFSFVGFMAYELDKDVSEVVDSGPGLAFIVYPEAVSLLPGAKIWAMLFFIMLLLLGFGTQFSILETIVTIIKDDWPKGYVRPHNRVILGLTCLLMFAVGLTMVTEGGVYILTLLDNHAGTFSALINGFVEVLVISWIYGANRFLDDIQVMFKWRTNTKRYRLFRLLWNVMWRVVTPALLLAILVTTFAQHKSLSYEWGEAYPAWARSAGWAVTTASVVAIPVVAAAKVAAAKGSLWERFQTLLRPTAQWGPKILKDREAARRVWAERMVYFASSPEESDLAEPSLLKSVD